MKTLIIKFAVCLLLFPYCATAGANVLPDPTKPYAFRIKPEVVEASSLDKDSVNWDLKGIHINKDIRRAILNGKLVQEGDSIGPGRVLEIKPGSVLLEYEDQQIVVRLLSTDVNMKKESQK